MGFSIPLKIFDTYSNCNKKQDKFISVCKLPGSSATCEVLKVKPENKSIEWP
jgi:hypothetical protein